MKTITQYESNSGIVFSTKEAAIKEDEYYDSAQAILMLLPNTDGIKFANGEGYLQCNPEMVEQAKREFLKLTSEYFKQKFTSVNGIVGRYISDSQSSAFNELSYKLSSIDSDYRMWGQIYFAINIGKGEDIRLN